MLIVHRAEVRGFRTSDPYPSLVSPATPGRTPVFNSGKIFGTKIPEKISEAKMLMAADIALALDPALIGERVGLTLDPWQATLIREQPKRALLPVLEAVGQVHRHRAACAACLDLPARVLDPVAVTLAKTITRIVQNPDALSRQARRRSDANGRVPVAC